MQAMIFFANLISMILCAIILDCFFSIFGARKFEKKAYIVLFNLVYIIGGMICNIFIKNQIAYILLMFVPTVLYSLLFNLQIAKRIYTTISIQIIVILSEFIFSLLIGALSDLTPEELASNIIVYMLAVALSKVTVFAIIKPIAMRTSHNKSQKMPKQILIGFIILPITSFTVMIYMTKSLYVADKLSLKIVGLCISALLVISNVIIFFLFENILRVKDKEQEMTQKSMILESEKQYYADLYEKQSTSDKIMHDLKHKFYAFKEMLENDSVKAKEMVDGIYEELESVQKMKITGIVGVDSLLSTKNLQAKQSGIDITITSFITDTIMVNDIDLCVILGNLLDNSIEACLKDKKTDKKTIYAQMLQEDGRMIIKISNTYENKAFDGKTSKKDKIHHGFGLQNVTELIKKYKGYYLVDKKDNIYSTTIIL